MPRDHFPGSPQEWMQRARASLAPAKADQVPGVLLEDLGVLVPEDVDQAIVLTRYAVETRYPGVYERVEVEEHQEAIRHAETVLAWVEIQMNPRGIQTP